MGHSWFRSWRDAYHEALFRAGITGLRYRVRYDAANGWWNITETTDRMNAEVRRG